MGRPVHEEKPSQSFKDSAEQLQFLLQEIEEERINNFFFNYYFHGNGD